MKTAQITITPDSATSTITVQGPYSAENNEVYRELRGKFADGAWNLPDNNATRKALAELFGTKSEIVSVLVPVGDPSLVSLSASYNPTVQIGGYLLATRRTRDAAVQLAPGVELVAGQLAKRGGSVKNPAVGSLEGCVFLLNCRKSFAEVNQLEIETTPLTHIPEIDV